MTSRRSLLRAATWRSRRKQYLRWTQSVCVLVREEPGRSEGRRPREEEDDDDEEEVLGTRARRLWRRKKEGGAERRRRSPAGAARRSESCAGQCEPERAGDAAAAAAHPISGPAVRGLAAGSRAPGKRPPGRVSVVPGWAWASKPPRALSSSDSSFQQLRSLGRRDPLRERRVSPSSLHKMASWGRARGRGGLQPGPWVSAPAAEPNRIRGEGVAQEHARKAQRSSRARHACLISRLLPVRSPGLRQVGIGELRLPLPGLAGLCEWWDSPVSPWEVVSPGREAQCEQINVLTPPEV